MAEDERLIELGARAVIAAAMRTREVFLSPITAWEIGLLAERGRLSLDRSLDDYIATLFDPRRFRLAPVTPVVAARSSFLPGELHRDPADRMLVATARDVGLTLVTRDERLLAYGRAGHLRTLAC